MITQICPVCGNTPHEHREWRHCGKQGDQLVCTNHCKSCEYRGEPGDVHYCQYYIGRAERKKVDIPKLEQQIKDKKILIEKHYSENKPKLAERAIWEMVKLQTKLREAEHEIHIT